MANVYTSQLGILTGDSVTRTFGPWPGYRVVVTDLAAVNFGADGSLFAAGDPTAGFFFAGVTWPDTMEFAAYHWTGRAVIGDSDELELFCDGPTLAVASGYLLTLP